MAARIDDTGDELVETHEINVTPFIDVMLVLLIIFMVAAPLSTVDVHVDLPVSTAKPQPKPDKPVYLTIKQDRTLSIGNDAVPRTQLVARLGEAVQFDKNKRIFLRADQNVPYGELMNVLNVMRDAGYLKVALMGLEGVPTPAAAQTEPDGTNARTSGGTQ